MSIYRLPKTLSLHTQVPSVLKYKKGFLIAETLRTYPSLFANLEEIKAATEKERRGKRPRKEISENWPVAMDEKGLWTDFRWWVFQVFSDPDRDFDSHHETLMKELSRDPSLWDVRCPAIEGHETLIGKLMEEYGKRMGGAPRRANFNPTPTMQDYPLITLLDGKTASQILDFQDRGRTLLDLAISHQQWEMAEALWDMGARWSTHHVESGQVLEGLIVGWAGVRESAYEGWLKGTSPSQTEALRMKWLDTWLGRYEKLRGSLPTEPTLDRRWRGFVESGMRTNHFLDSPVTLFLSRMFHVDGPRVRGLDTMPDFSRSMLERWCKFWADQGVDLLSQRIPKAVFPEEVPVETTVMELWKGVKGLEEMTLKADMEAQLPTSPTAGKKPGAGGRF